MITATNYPDDLGALWLLRVIGPSDHTTIVATPAIHMGMPKRPDLATFIVSAARKRMVFAICSMFLHELVVDVFISPQKSAPPIKRALPNRQNFSVSIILLSSKIKVFTISNKISLGNYLQLDAFTLPSQSSLGYFLGAETGAHLFLFLLMTKMFVGCPVIWFV